MFKKCNHSDRHLLQEKYKSTFLGNFDRVGMAMENLEWEIR
ncbi:hypothetical protein [Spirulina sp. 06S082]|nr:hypothetical protein [Spirulina sp. 06S082]MEA5472286.1 hypothetical protein [Spirulina sp. 06S082]